MLATTNDLISHVAAHAGVSATLAECAIRAVLAEIGGYLSPGRRQFVSDELPTALAAAILSGAGASAPIDKQVMALGTSALRAHVLIASICRVLAEQLSTEALAAILAAVPVSLARLIVGVDPAESIAADHAADATTMLHGAQGPAQERRRETLAECHPGSASPVSGSPR